MGDAKRKAAVGLTATIGLGGMHLADDVVRLGARSVGGMGDDIARVGMRAGNPVDDALVRGASADLAGVEGSTVIDDVGRAGSSARHPSTSARPSYSPVPNYGPTHGPRARGSLSAGARTDPGQPRWGDLVEHGVDLSLEFIDFSNEVRSDVSDYPGSDVSDDLGDNALAPAGVIEATTYPRFFDLTEDPEAWQRFVFQPDTVSAPLIFVSTGVGEAFAIAGQARSLADLGATCWASGTTCIFVACDSHDVSPVADCVAASRAQFVASRGQGHATVGGFVSEFNFQRMETWPRPAYIATAGGEAPVVERLGPKSQ